MKIIWESNKSLRRECMSCGSILEIDKNDLIDSAFYHDKIFTCPICRSSNPISYEDELILGDNE